MNATRLWLSRLFFAVILMTVCGAALAESGTANPSKLFLLAADGATWAQWASATATFLAVLVVLWPALKDRIWPPELALEPHNSLRASNVPLPNGQQAYVWHLLVRNSRPDKLAKGCRVQLVGMRQRRANGAWGALPLPVPLSFVWTPAEEARRTRQISHMAVLDFGRVTEGEDPELGVNPDGLEVFFLPPLQSYTHGFAGFILQKGVTRYQLEIESHTHRGDSIYEVEVQWDGERENHPDAMNQHVTATLHKTAQ